jgi:preprotein translocase subunit SecA
LQAPPEIPSTVPDPSAFEFKHEAFEGLGQDAAAAEPEAAVEVEKKPFVRPDRKVGRNDPCPCGSGKKYKHCHGKLS